jgi:hypothetical protein
VVEQDDGHGVSGYSWVVRESLQERVARM